MTKARNVLFILADQHRADCLGCAGHPAARTPHLDALAARGTRFDAAFCNAPVCTPSRYSLLTGLLPFQHGGLSNASTPRPGLPIFPGELRSQGWSTAAVGKVHATPTYLDLGFDRMTLAEQHGDGRWADDYHRDLMKAEFCDLNDFEDQVAIGRNNARLDYRKNFGASPSNLPEELHSTRWIGDRAIHELKNWKPSGGNLLQVGFIKPHHPFDPPAEYLDAFDPDTLPLPPDWTDDIPPFDRTIPTNFFDYSTLDRTSFRRVLHHYLASLAHLDTVVGEILAALRKTGMESETLVIYASDHGEYLGCHHLLLKQKYLYDPLVRVPLIISGPGFASNTVDSGLVELIDLAPTILGATGNQSPVDWIGLDLAEPNRRNSVYCEWIHSEAGHLEMVRTRNHKLIVGEPFEHALFDLSDDPYELTNRIDDPDCQTTVEQLRTLMRERQGESWTLDNHVDSAAPVVRADSALTASDNDERRIWFEREFLRQTLASHREKNA